MGAIEMEPLHITVASVLNAKNHFEVIGLPMKACGGSELRKAYKQTALKVHPDKCDDNRAIEAFRRLQEAFAVLSDPALHARYMQTLASANSAQAARVAAGRARARSAAYESRSRVSKEDLERQVKEMMSRQSKTRPMATGQAAAKAAEERVAKEKARQARLEAEERARQAEAARRREQAEKALNSARSRATPRRSSTPRQKEEPAVELDPEAQKAADERARRRAASMAFLGDSMGWAKATKRGEDEPSTARDSARDSSRRPSSARSAQHGSPFGDLRSVKRSQTDRGHYLPRYMQRGRSAAVVKI